jgi:hypothetical protein
MISGPKIVIENFEGKNNLPERYESFRQMGTYRNLNTICVIPTRGKMLTKVALSWMNLAGGFNSAMVRMMVEGCEVGAAYNYALKVILTEPTLQKFPYILTLEEDNTPPPDGLQKLLTSVQEYDAVSGLYWLKGSGGCPQIWGDPKQPGTFAPQLPIPDSLQRCNGIGMGFAIWRLDMFRNPGFTFGEWFKTAATPPDGPCTQDLYFCKKAGELGYKFAVDTKVKVGHVDVESGEVW